MRRPQPHQPWNRTPNYHLNEHQPNVVMCLMCVGCRACVHVTDVTIQYRTQIATCTYQYSYDYIIDLWEIDYLDNGFHICLTFNS